MVGLVFRFHYGVHTWARRLPAAFCVWLNRKNALFPFSTPLGSRPTWASHRLLLHISAGEERHRLADGPKLAALSDTLPACRSSTNVGIVEASCDKTPENGCEMRLGLESNFERDVHNLCVALTQEFFGTVDPLTEDELMGGSDRCCA